MKSKRKIVNIVLGTFLIVSLGFALIQLQQLNTAKQALSAIQAECETSKSELDASKAKLTEIQASLEQAEVKQAQSLADTNKSQSVVSADRIVTAEEQAQFNQAKNNTANTNKGGTQKPSNNTATSKPKPVQTNTESSSKADSNIGVSDDDFANWAGTQGGGISKDKAEEGFDAIQ